MRELLFGQFMFGQFMYWCQYISQLSDNYAVV